ncbi:hypothetical protein CXB51_016191 [Gossypium anomalum]|uniref:Uncharacterized protein n=1 Tax=Gossypium anomalum TaxID=47600 RepID=A0A8J6CYQ3_9ROSI|nr:hypothetical protein CXB51_016191 [Gossypium anomalum]
MLQTPFHFILSFVLSLFLCLQQIGTHTCKEMEFNVCSSPAKKQSQSQSLPPRRGQVKMRILKTILKSVTSMASPKESVPHLSSTSTTAAPTPTGYLSD